MKFVVTARRGKSLLDQSVAAVKAGADIIEVRSDMRTLYSARQLDSLPLPILYALRDRVTGVNDLVERSVLVDFDLKRLSEISFPGFNNLMISHHAHKPVDAETIIDLFSNVSGNYRAIKYVEPVEEDRYRQYVKLEAVRMMLYTRFKEINMSVTGENALPLRRELAKKNTLYYCTLDSSWSSAEGQGILEEERNYFKNHKDSFHV